MSHSENVIGEFKELFFRRIHVIWNEKMARKTPQKNIAYAFPFVNFHLLNHVQL